MTRTNAGTKTRAYASTLLAHHSDQAHKKPLKTTNKHTLPTRSLTRTLTHSFGSVQSAEMSVLTMVAADFKETLFVRFSSHFTTIFGCVSTQVQFMTHTCSTACSLSHYSINSKSPIQ
jgi:hypothetical protein